MFRSHMRSVHNASSSQTQVRTSVSPAPTNYGQPNAHISYQPTNQSYYAQKIEEGKMADASGHVPASGSIGSLAMFNASTSRLHGSDDGFNQQQNANMNSYRAGSRLTPSEENILNRNLTTLSAAPQRSTTPSTTASTSPTFTRRQIQMWILSKELQEQLQLAKAHQRQSSSSQSGFVFNVSNESSSSF